MSRSPVGTARQAGIGGIEGEVWVEAVELLATGEDVVTARNARIKSGSVAHISEEREDLRFELEPIVSILNPPFASPFFPFSSSSLFSLATTSRSIAKLLPYSAN